MQNTVSEQTLNTTPNKHNSAQQWTACQSLRINGVFSSPKRLAKEVRKCPGSGAKIFFEK